MSIENPKFAQERTYCSPAADAIRKTIKKAMNCRKTTINLKRHGFCGQGQVKQIVGQLRGVLKSHDILFFIFFQKASETFQAPLVPINGIG